MARNKSSSSSSSKWRYGNLAYYLKRRKRLALRFIVFVSVTLVVRDRHTLVSEHEVELSKLNGEVARLQNLVGDMIPGSFQAQHSLICPFFPVIFFYFSLFFGWWWYREVGSILSK